MIPTAAASSALSGLPDDLVHPDLRQFLARLADVKCRTLRLAGQARTSSELARTAEEWRYVAHIQDLHGMTSGLEYGDDPTAINQAFVAGMSAECSAHASRIARRVARGGKSVLDQMRILADDVRVGGTGPDMVIPSDMLRDEVEAIRRDVSDAIDVATKCADRAADAARTAAGDLGTAAAAAASAKKQKQTRQRLRQKRAEAKEAAAT